MQKKRKKKLKKKNHIRLDVGGCGHFPELVTDFLIGSEFEINYKKKYMLY